VGAAFGHIPVALAVMARPGPAPGSATSSTPGTITFPGGIDPVLSPKDTAAPTLSQAPREGLLPSYDACR